jgi:hypothetical protein
LEQLKNQKIIHYGKYLFFIVFDLRVLQGGEVVLTAISMQSPFAPLPVKPDLHVQVTVVVDVNTAFSSHGLDSHRFSQLSK